MSATYRQKTGRPWASTPGIDSHPQTGANSPIASAKEGIHMRKVLVGILSVIVTAVCAQGAPDLQDVTALRLLPPSATGLRPEMQTPFAMLPALVRQRHPEVFENAVAGIYVVSLLLDFEGRVQRSTATQVDPADAGTAMRAALPPIDGIRTIAVAFQKDRPLPDGSSTKNNVTLVSMTLPEGFDESRAVSRVHAAVRSAHSDLLLPGDGPVLNRLTVLMNEDGSIQRHVLEQSRREDLRRAPLEDAQFAERMAARISNVLAVDAARLGVVGFTYVMEPNPAALQPRSAGSLAVPRTVLVQYAWPRKAGETGPSAPMTAATQQATRNFDEKTALRLAEHYFPDAFTNIAPEAGTPTIALSPQGEVIAAGRVQYGSGLNHERLVGEQLVPGIRSGAFVSPRLTNGAGQSAVVSFVWRASN
jgi:hypothetical protein